MKNVIYKYVFLFKSVYDMIVNVIGKYGYFLMNFEREIGVFRWIWKYRFYILCFKKNFKEFFFGGYWLLEFWKGDCKIYFIIFCFSNRIFNLIV